MIRTGSIRLGQSVSDGTQLDWSWNESAETASAAVSAQEVDPLTEYQVYKQFGYQGKAAESLAAYLDGIPDGEAKPENLIRELIDINLEVGDVDVLADNLQKYGRLIPFELVEILAKPDPVGKCAGVDTLVGIFDQGIRQP